MGRKVADAPRDYKRGLAAAGGGLRHSAQEGEQKHRDPGEKDCVHNSKPLSDPILVSAGETSRWTTNLFPGRSLLLLPIVL